MRILFVAAEAAPFVSVGGLSQVLYFLPTALKKLGHDVRIITPLHGAMQKTGRRWSMQRQAEIPVPVEKAETLSCFLHYYKGTSSIVPSYFVENTEYFSLRANVFGYGDDHIRFSLFSRTVLEWLTHQQKSGDWMPDVIHCNDWHTGYVIDWGRRQSPYQSAFRQISFVYTVHNFSYQGNYDFRYQSPRDDGTEPLADILNPALQRQNPLLRGILYADSVNTVSPTHAIEVTTPEYAEGLEDVLLAEKGKLSGILNGLDTREFNPLKDPLVKYRFSKSTAHTQRPKNKTVLQKQFFLDPNPKAPLLTFLGRLAPQKGWDLLFETLPHLLSHIPDTQLIVVGNGDDLYRQRLFALQKSFPKQIGLHLQSDFRLPRMLFAGGDMMLIPSMFEPGGIVALEALRYGNVPIIRRTGGLNDIVTDFDPHTRSGNGFSFKDRDPWALFATIVSAITLYRQPSVWHTLIYNAMESDFSWEHSAKEYDLWYADARKKRIRALKMSPHPAYIPQRI